MNIKTLSITALVVFYFILGHCMAVRADYVLPYPSYMPGNKLYKVMRIVDKVKRFWYWGNIGQIKYHLELSDKYLVEAKTLMEYNQFLLASDALIRSDGEFMQLPKYIDGAAKEGVDTVQLRQLVHQAADKHNEVLLFLLSSTPASVIWSPEKAAATTLLLHKALENSQQILVSVRQQITH